MCDPVTIAMITTAVSTAAKGVNSFNTMKKKDRQAAEGIRRQGVLSSEANKRVNEQIEDIAGSTGESERAESLEGFLNAIRAAQSDTEGALDPIAGANPRFAENVEGGKAEIAASGATQASRLSRIDAPRFQRQAESARVGRTASGVNELGRQSTVEDFLTRLRVAAEQPNQLVDLLATIGQGVGSVMSLGAGSAASGPSIIGEAGVNIGGAGAVNPFSLVGGGGPSTDPSFLLRTFAGG